MEIQAKRPFKWICSDCDAGDHGLCLWEMDLDCQCGCREHSDPFIVSVLQ